MEFNPKKVRTTIVPPMTAKGPICHRKYSIFASRITCEYFLTISDEFCLADKHNKIADEVLARWYQDDCDIYTLKIYVNIGDENSVIAFARYIMFKQLLPNYIHTILHGDREFFKQNKNLLNSPIFVRFMSKCEKFNRVESYGTLKAYNRRDC